MSKADLDAILFHIRTVVRWSHHVYDLTDNLTDAGPSSYDMFRTYGSLPYVNQLSACRPLVAHARRFESHVEALLRSEPEGLSLSSISVLAGFLSHAVCHALDI